MSSPVYEVCFPEYFDEVVWEIEAKGYFADLTILSQGRRYRPVVYDRTRLAQEVADELATEGVYSERSLVVVERITRASIEEAVAKLAAAGFQGLVAAD